MTSTSFGRWLRAANPLTEPRGMAEAQRAARMGGLALLIEAVAGSVGLYWRWQNPSQFQEYLAEALRAQNLPAAQLAVQEAMLPYMLTMTTVFEAILLGLYVVLAWVQWRWMTRAIPIIFLVLIAFTMASGALMLAIQGSAPPEIWPLAISVLTWASRLTFIALMIAALKGSVALHRLRLER